MFRQALEGEAEPGDSFSQDSRKSAGQLGVQRFDQYELVKGEDGKSIELGRGAMGVTYKAFDVDLQCFVTLKVISDRHLDDEKARLRFLREARAAASLRHTNVASVLHLGQSGGNYFYAMEFVAGETLERLIRRSGRLETKLALEIATQVASGLAAIHKETLVHRDIKPSNIMVNVEEAEGVTAKIIDLGLAKAKTESPSASLTSIPGAFAGTPEFASPEQFAGVGVDIRSDLYSLGATLWEMLSGQTPFRGSPAELMYQHLHTPLPLEQLTEVPQPLVVLLQILLDKDPARRFQDPAQLLKAVPAVWDAIDSNRPLTREQLLQDASGRVAGARRSTTRRLKAVGTFVAGSRFRRIQWGAAALLVIAGGALIFWIYLPIYRRSALPMSGSPALPATTPLSPSADAPAASVAVLPFESLSDNKSDTYFADGVQDEILSSLAKIAQLKVISRTSVMAYRPGGNRNLRSIAGELGVAHIVEGTVRRQGNRSRITTALIDAQADQTLWSDSYERDSTDIFAIQSEIAQTVASKLRARLSAREQQGIAEKPTDNLEAYDLFLQAKDSYAQIYAPVNEGHRESLLTTVRLLEEATRKDPKFVLAYCLMAKAHGALYAFGYDKMEERRAHADGAVNEALRLRPDLPEVHLAAAVHRYFCYRDYKEARAHLAIAQRALPNNAEALALSAYMDRRQGNLEGAMRYLEKAVALDPRNPEFLFELAGTHFNLRRYQTYEKLFDRLIALQRNNPVLKGIKTTAALEGRADLTTFRRAVQSLPPSIFNDMDVISLRIYGAILARDWPEAKEIVRNTSHPNLRLFEAAALGPVVPRGCVELIIERLEGDRPPTELEFALVRNQLGRTVEANPQDAMLLSALAIVDAALGRKEIAIQEARRAVERLPVAQDALVGPTLGRNLAIVYVWTNEQDLALAELAVSAKTPGGVTYGSLKLDPRWDPIRKDPRFEQLVSELAPHE